MARDETHWPCNQCGADLRFAPGATQLVCDHCGATQAIPDLPAARSRSLNEIDLALGELPGRPTILVLDPAPIP